MTEIREHEGIQVARDDLFPGGTKARFMAALFERAEEVVYASPCEGGAQTALAHVARELGKKATIFVAKRKQPHPRTLMAKRLGAQILQVSPGYLNVVHARAEAYARDFGATLAPFGFDIPEASEAIQAASRELGIAPNEVWCAAGSGVLTRALAKTFPKARRYAVQVGRDLKPEELAGATLMTALLKFEQPHKGRTPFPSDPHYDAKAWELCRAHHGPGLVLFWNVTGPAEP